MKLDSHIQKLPSRAQVQQGIFNRVARTGWGLETVVLRIARQAVIGSLLRYARVPVGSEVPADLLTQIEVNIVNTAVRRVAGLHRTARIESLHLLAGPQSYKNMYIQKCAEFLDESLRVSDGTIEPRLRRDLNALIFVSGEGPKELMLEIPLYVIILYDFVQTEMEV